MFFHRYALHSQERLLAGTLGTLFLLLILVGCNSIGPAPAPTPTPTTQPLQFVEFDLGLPAKALNAPVIGTVPDDSKMHVVVTFKTNQSLLNQLKNQQVQPGQTVNLQNLANKIGISDATYAKIKAYLGFAQVTLKLDALHTNLGLDGTAATFARIFQTHFVLHRLENRTFFAPATPPKVPTFLAPQIVAITGLDNYSQAPRSHNFLLTPHFVHKQLASCGPFPGLINPPQVAHAYGYDRLWAQGWQGQFMTVNFVELEGFAPSDIQNYFSCVHFHGSLKTVNVDTPPPATAGFGESTLDIEMAAGLAPAINIVVYQSNLSSNATDQDFWTSFNDELTQIVNDNTRSIKPSVVSISWGEGEDLLTPGVIQSVDTNLQLLTKAEHMTVFVASGDCAAFDDGVFKHLGVDFPGSDSVATDVGGTVLNVNTAGDRSSEVVWSDGSDTSKCTNQWGSGGGISQLFKEPDISGVNGLKNRFSTGMREVPDLSAVAVNLPEYVQGQWEISGGTSAAAPIWATGLSLVNQGLILRKGAFVFGPDLFYDVDRLSASGNVRPFNDIVSGNNLYYPATPGWDFASGLGAPNLFDFFTVVSNNLLFANIK